MFAFIFISWHQFLLTVLGLGLLYYTGVGLLYFRRELLAMIRKQPAGPSVKEGEGGSPFLADEPEFGRGDGDEDAHWLEEEDNAAAETGQFPTAYALVDAIKAVLLNGAQRELVRQELLQALRSLIHSPAYNSLHEASFMVAINNLISAETMKQCGYQLTPEELRMLWDK